MKKPYTPQENGQGFVEYALIMLAIVLSGLIVLNLFGVSISDLYTSVIDAVETSPSGKGEGADGEQGAQEQVTLFEDDFSKGLANWNILSSKFWKGKVSTNKERLKVERLGAAFAKGVSGSDYIISVNGTTLQRRSGNNQGFAVIFRSSSETVNFDGYVFEIEKEKNKSTGTMMFRKWENGVQIDKPITSVPVPPGFNWNNPGDIQVDVKGDTFTAYLNGQQVLTATDSSYTNGGVGVAANFGSNLFVDGLTVQSVP
jgi:Flp pilus assembly pilin Flp